MTEWYVSSVNHNALPVWQATTAYSLGDMVRATTTSSDDEMCVYRVTTAGTSGGTEPYWVFDYNATMVDNTVTWTNVTGDSAYGWSSAAGSLLTVIPSSSRTAPVADGDIIYVASDHDFSYVNDNYPSINLKAEMKLISVNRAGSVPPVSTDYQPGGKETVANGDYRGLNITGNQGTSPYIAYMYGMKFVIGDGAATASAIYIDNQKMVDCSFEYGSTAITADYNEYLSFSNVDIKDITVKPVTTRCIMVLGRSSLDGMTMVGPTTPTVIFSASESTITGVDLSSIPAGTCLVGGWSTGNTRFIDCALPTSYDMFFGVSLSQNYGAPVVTIESSSGEIFEMYTINMTTSMESTIVRSSGAVNTNPYSWKVVTDSTYYPNAVLSKKLPVLAIWNSVVGSPVSVTIELMSDGLILTDRDVWVDVVYPSSSSTNLSSITTTEDLNPLSAATSLHSSTAAWTTTGLTTPTAQKLTVTFTAQRAGYIYAHMYVAKLPATFYVDPRLTLV